MGFQLFTFISVFLLIASAGLLMFYRQAMVKRIRQVINLNREQKTFMSTIKQTGFSIGNVVERFEQVMPKSEKEVSVTKQRLARAGFREESAVKLFYGSKVLTPLLLCLLAMVTGLASLSPLLVYLLGLGLGFLAPDFWLGRKIKARQKRIRKGLPDVLDLLVICMEAGLSLDQATARTAKELNKACPDLCQEMGVVVLEQRAGRARSEAWRGMADRADVDSLSSMVSMLVQTEQFGTSIAKMLRVHADTMRTQRVQMVEEMAAKTSVKLVFPLVFFIFPSLFLVTLGPAVLVMLDTFKKM
jgi:tight adherence protein C